MFLLPGLGRESFNRIRGYEVNNGFEPTIKEFRKEVGEGPRGVCEEEGELSWTEEELFRRKGSFC